MNIVCLIIGMLVAALGLLTPARAQQPQIEVTVIQPAINQETRLTSARSAARRISAS